VDRAHAPAGLNDAMTTTPSTTVADRLTASGHRLTAQRMIVAAALTRARRTVSAQELYGRLRAEHPYLGRATVFRTLDFLVDIGLAQRFEGDGHVYVYTACEEAHHHHLVCRRCGATTSIDDAAVGRLISSVRDDYGFALDHDALDFYGTCANCRASLG
jgi:Fur family ferric uptake transcriptional regulator